ncbi:MAG: hypothetical protein WC685_07610 [Methylobacter sp.]|jgi:hypothetical protein
MKFKLKLPVETPYFTVGEIPAITAGAVFQDDRRLACEKEHAERLKAAIYEGTVITLNPATYAPNDKDGTGYPKPLKGCGFGGIDIDAQLVTINQLIKFAKTLNIEINTPEIKPTLSGTERSNMLKMLLFMATDAYGYDPDKTRNDLTGDNKNSLSAKMQRVGIDVSNDTVRRYLKEAKKLS